MTSIEASGVKMYTPCTDSGASSALVLDSLQVNKIVIVRVFEVLSDQWAIGLLGFTPTTWGVTIKTSDFYVVDEI